MNIVTGKATNLIITNRTLTQLGPSVKCLEWQIDDKPMQRVYSGNGPFPTTCL